MTEYKRPGNRPSPVVLTAKVRADLKTRGFVASPGGTLMSRQIGPVSITIHENGNCNVHLPNKFHPVTFKVDEYWSASILYIAQREIHKESARIRKDAEDVATLADKVMDVVCGKTK